MHLRLLFIAGLLLLTSGTVMAETSPVPACIADGLGEGSLCAYSFGRSVTAVTACNVFSPGLLRSQCIHGLAKKTDKPSLCRRIPRIHADQAYLGHFFHGSSVREDCFAGIAAHTGKPSLCRQVRDPLDRKFCIITIGVERKDVSFCRFVPAENREECECNVTRAITGVDKDCSPRK
jgi:hypothetical protein